METIEKQKWEELLASAETGSPEAQWEVGYYLEQGAVDTSGDTIVAASASEALRWYSLAAEQGDPSAQMALSNLLSSGDGIERDFAAAIRWARKTMDQGGSTAASAAYNLGTIYRDLKKPAMAFRYYRRALSMDDDDALLQIALCHLFGFGTKQDVDAAYAALQRLTTGEPSASCQRSRENALYWIAVLTLLGLGKGRKSVAGARKLLEMANADDDHEQANEILNLIGKSRYLKS